MRSRFVCLGLYEGSSEVISIAIALTAIESFFLYFVGTRKSINNSYYLTSANYVRFRMVLTSM